MLDRFLADGDIGAGNPFGEDLNGFIAVIAREMRGLREAGGNVAPSRSAWA